MDELGGPLLECVDPLLALGLSLEVGGVLRGVQFFLALIEDDEGAFFEVLEEALLHDVGDLIEEAPEVAMAVVVIEDPAQPLVDPEDEVVEVVLVARVVDV